MEASRSAAAALAAARVDWYTWYTARTEATIMEASKVHIRATESAAVIRKEVRSFDIFREHAHFEHKAEEEDHHEREVAEQAELIVASAFERLRHGYKEGNHE